MSQNVKGPVGDEHDGTWATEPINASNYPGLDRAPAETLAGTQGTGLPTANAAAGPATAGIAGSTGGIAAGTGSQGTGGSQSTGSGSSESSSEFDLNKSRVLLAPGKDICDGKFHLIEKIGGGAMGDVWKVKHNDLGRTSVLKVIKRELAANRSARKRFSREGQLMARLDHPNAVKVFDLGFKDGLAFMEMELVKGQSLDKILKEEKDGKESKTTRPMPLDWILLILDQLCDVLQEAHTFCDEDGKLRPIVHRDLKPSNLMLVESKPPGQNLKVLDFGIAKMTEATKSTPSEDASLATQGFIGTPSYASPEQINNEPVDGRSDLYAVGVFLYQLLTGRLPYNGRSFAEVVVQHLYKDPPPMAEANPKVAIPPAVESVVCRCLAKSPEDRPQSAKELARLFREAVGQEATLQAPTPRKTTGMELRKPGRKWKPPNHLWISTVAGLCVLFLVVGATYSVRNFRAKVPYRPSIQSPIDPAPPAPAVAVVANPTPPSTIDGIKVPEGYEVADLGLAGGGRKGLQRKADGVRFYRIGSGAYLPVGYEPENLDDRVGAAWPRVILRKKEGVDRAEWVRFIRISGKAYFQGDFRLLKGGGDGDPSLPPHKVKVSSFYLQETEVTNREIKSFLLNHPGFRDETKKWNDAMVLLGSTGQADPKTVLDFPAVWVSYEAAKFYAGTVKGRLPTESEWELAARSGIDNYWSWKSIVPETVTGNANLAEAGISFPVAVKTYKKDQTEDKVFDMTGNVREWCLDGYRPYPTPKPEDRPLVNPVVPADSESLCVARGGFYATPLAEAMNFLRGEPSPKEGAGEIGFRVVIECPPFPSE